MKILYFMFGVLITLGFGIGVLYWTESSTASRIDILILMVAGYFLGMPTGYFIAGVGEDDNEL